VRVAVVEGGETIRRADRQAPTGNRVGAAPGVVFLGWPAGTPALWLGPGSGADARREWWRAVTVTPSAHSRIAKAPGTQRPSALDRQKGLHLIPAVGPSHLGHGEDPAYS
jgi:hypothetical protein